TEGDVGQRGAAHTARAAAIAVEAAAYIIRDIPAVGLPRGDDDPIQTGAGRDGRRGAIQPHYMVSIEALDVVHVSNYAALIGIVAAANVAAVNRMAFLPIALFQLLRTAGKTSIEGEARRDVEGVATSDLGRLAALSPPEFLHLIGSGG